tara:strand:+ start:9142 stop:9408 length:267 start_codon:yes stop_codon:yes gene_type:complete
MKTPHEEIEAMIANEISYRTFDITVFPDEEVCHYFVVTIERNKSLGTVEIEWNKNDPMFPDSVWCENQMKIQKLDFHWTDFDDYGMNF